MADSEEVLADKARRAARASLKMKLKESFLNRKKILDAQGTAAPTRYLPKMKPSTKVRSKKLLVKKGYGKDEIAKIMKDLQFSLVSFLGGEGNVFVSDIDTSNEKKLISSAEIGTDDMRRLDCYLRLSPEAHYRVSFYRASCEFTKFEEAFVNQLIKGLHFLTVTMKIGTHDSHYRAAFVGSAFEIAVARYLRNGQEQFWKLQSLIQHLKHFSFARYEGQACTIGFLWVNSADEIFERLEGNYHFEKFDKKIEVDSGFFESILAYRYLDGIRSVYIVDSQLKILGIAELKEGPYSNVDLKNHTPFYPLIQGVKSKAFYLFVTKKSEIDILATTGNMLRWRKGRWTQLNYGIFKKLIGDFFSEPEDLDLLVKLVISLSASNQGAILLLSDDKALKKSETYYKKIDEGSEIGTALRIYRLNKSIKLLNSRGILTSILSTDGLTVINSKGKITEASALIRLDGLSSLREEDDGKAKIIDRGGGRSAAAKKASRYGLTIKVSVDGPIQIFSEEKLVLEIN